MKSGFLCSMSYSCLKVGECVSDVPDAILHTVGALKKNKTIELTKFHLKMSGVVEKKVCDPHTFLQGNIVLGSTYIPNSSIDLLTK